MDGERERADVGVDGMLEKEDVLAEWCRREEAGLALRG